MIFPIILRTEVQSAVGEKMLVIFTLDPLGTHARAAALSLEGIAFPKMLKHPAYVVTHIKCVNLCRSW